MWHMGLGGMNMGKASVAMSICHLQGLLRLTEIS